VDESSSAGTLPIRTVGAPIINAGATAGTHGRGGLDILQTPNDGMLIVGLRSRTVATVAPPANTPFPGGTENRAGAPVWLPEQTTIALEQISFAIVALCSKKFPFSARLVSARLDASLWPHPPEQVILGGNAAEPQLYHPRET